MATITDHMPTPPMADSNSAAQSRVHAYADSGTLREASSSPGMLCEAQYRKNTTGTPAFAGVPAAWPQSHLIGQSPGRNIARRPAHSCPSGRDVRVDAEQVLRVVGRLQRAQTRVVVPVRSADFLGPVIRREMVHVRTALQVRLQLGPERPHP